MGIRGYRELTEVEIALINKIKAKGEELESMVHELRAMESVDQRWVSIGATDLQTGLMAVIRGVAQPTNF